MLRALVEDAFELLALSAVVSLIGLIAPAVVGA
jgi:hypothetical protein